MSCSEKAPLLPFPKIACRWISPWLVGTVVVSIPLQVLFLEAFEAVCYEVSCLNL